MSEETPNVTPETTPEAAPAAAPAPGSPEYNAQMIARSGNVPEKFVDAGTGEVNMEAFINSYKELERQFHGSQAEPVVEEAAPVAEAAPVEEAPAAEETPIVDELALRDPAPEAPAEEAAGPSLPASLLKSGPSGSLRSCDKGT